MGGLIWFGFFFLLKHITKDTLERIVCTDLMQPSKNSQTNQKNYFFFFFVSIFPFRTFSLTHKVAP